MKYKLERRRRRDCTLGGPGKREWGGSEGKKGKEEKDFSDFSKKKKEKNLIGPMGDVTRLFSEKKNRKKKKKEVKFPFQRSGNHVKDLAG